jgi:hypothetical protein
MANQRGTFAKRRREQELLERARAKQARRVARRNEPRTAGGPQIAWTEMVMPGDTDAASLPDPTGPDAAEDDPLPPSRAPEELPRPAISAGISRRTGR